MITVVGISGSLRAGSFNTALLRAAAGLMPSGAVLQVESIRGIPLYDGDIEATHGVPEAVGWLKNQIAAADALLIASPEYNNSIPGVLKNAVDWLTRPPQDSARVFANLPVAVIGASPGGFGTILAQNAWLPILRTLGTRPWFGGRLMVSHAGTVFNDKGELTDDKVRVQLQQFLAGFVAAAHAQHR